MVKNQKEILDKLNIEKLNPMQEEAAMAIESGANVFLLSPTGTGKTLAFLLPIIQKLDESSQEIQVLIIVPTRELALQIELVIREIGIGLKVNAVYGGRAGSKDKMDLKHRPAILVGTPGRIADHFRRENFKTSHIRTLILDEFDKSLEIGFEPEMKTITEALLNVEQKIFTSATKAVRIPDFLMTQNEVTIDYLENEPSQLKLKRIVSPTKDKLQTLIETLGHIGNQPGIIFCNFKDTIQLVSDHLYDHGIGHGCFYGDMDQKDRERALIKFRNGTHQLLVATDLAARGIDVSNLAFIIHYQLPQSAKEFTHRNGRTARMNTEGTAFLLQWENEYLPDFAKEVELEYIVPSLLPNPSIWKTLFVSGGRKDKISKGDIAGVFFKQAQLDKTELGVIEIKQDCAFVAVHSSKVKVVIQKLDNTRIKKKKVRIMVI
ncbi:DEAD/DEAH box helicase [Reichenbachiella sp. MALMAid0571]|uniref:DEAD/DEAH box helicase n=1 Tax=Reichenbachiella sp. MALMAid0571 TaxID=3143939 RepID=UPI0032DE8771